MLKFIRIVIITGMLTITGGLCYGGTNQLTDSNTASKKYDSPQDCFQQHVEKSMLPIEHLTLKFQCETDPQLKSQYKKIMSARTLRNTGIAFTSIGIAGFSIFLLVILSPGDEQTSQDEYDDEGSWGDMYDGLVGYVVATSLFSTLLIAGIPMWIAGGIKHKHRKAELEKMLKQKNSSKVTFNGITPYISPNKTGGLVASFSF